MRWKYLSVGSLLRKKVWYIGLSYCYRLSASLPKKLVFTLSGKVLFGSLMKHLLDFLLSDSVTYDFSHVIAVILDC